MNESVDVILNRPFKKALATNANTSTHASKIPTITEPSGDGIHQLGLNYGGTVPKSLLVLPYGLGADNDAFDMRVIGWRRIGSGARPDILWIPTILAELTCTISAAVGIVGAPVLNTERFADTITIKAATGEATITAATTRGGSVWTYSPTNDLVGWAVLDLLGVEKIEFSFDQTTNTPTMNALFAML